MKWELIVTSIEDGHEIAKRFCRSGQNAKTWGKAWWRGYMQTWPKGIKCEIFDPLGYLWAYSVVTENSHPLRMQWTMKTRREAGEDAKP